MTEQTQRRIYEAAVDFFYFNGFGGASLRDVADAAGVNVATIYHYYPSKRDLLLSIVDCTLSDLAQAVSKDISGSQSPSTKLAHLVINHTVFHCIRRQECAIVDREVNSLSVHDRVKQVSRRDDYEKLWDNVLVEGLDAGEFEVEDYRIARNALLTMCSQVSVWYSPSGRLSIQEVAAAYAEFALRMVRGDGTARYRSAKGKPSAAAGTRGYSATRR